MKRRIISVIVVLVSMAAIACGSTQVEQKSISEVNTDINENEIVKDYDMSKLNEFGLDIIKNNIENENLVISPLSVYLALNMVAEGADGNTKEELENVLGDLSYQKYVSREAADKLVKATDGMTLTINDSVWIDDMFEVNQDWADRVLSNNNCKAYNVKLEDKSTVAEMNKWIDNSTNGLIKNMITDPFTANDRLVIFDAIYMKGEWQKKFDAMSTYEDEFNVNNKETKNVDTMHMYDEKFKMFKNENLEGVILPYQDDNLVFIAIKAVDKNQYIKDIFMDLDEKELEKLISTAENRSIELSLPVFDVGSDITLNNSLQSLGIVDAFLGETADFSKLGASKDDNNIFISLVRQKARVKINEEGTEAAAVTEVLMGCKSAPMMEEPYEMLFKEPFFYMIIDIENQIPVFEGFMDNPLAK